MGKVEEKGACCDRSWRLVKNLRNRGIGSATRLQAGSGNQPRASESTQGHNWHPCVIINRESGIRINMHERN